jgi:hypothetical protein
MKVADIMKRLAFVIVAVVVSAFLALVELAIGSTIWGSFLTPGVYITISLFPPSYSVMIAGIIADSLLWFLLLCITVLLWRRRRSLLYEAEKKILFAMFVILAGMLSVLLALVWESLVSGLSFGTPGMYIVHWLFPHPSTGEPSPGRLDGIMHVIDFFLCFLLIGGSGLALMQHQKKRQSTSTVAKDRWERDPTNPNP